MVDRVVYKVTERDRQSNESFARALKRFTAKVNEECVVEEARMRSKKMKKSTKPMNVAPDTLSRP